MDVIETARLFMRPFRREDVEAAYGWFSDPVVMRYTPAGPDPTFEATRARLEGYQAHQREHGFSKWIVMDRASGRPIGDAGLVVLEDPGWIDLGFRFAQPFWGRGFATGVATTWVSAAFEKFGLEALGAFVHPENAPSIHVLEKVGFRPARERTVMGMSALCFSVRRQGAG